MLTINQDLIHIITVDIANHYRIVPENYINDHISFYIDSNHYSVSVTDELELLTGKTVSFISVSAEEIQKALSQLYRIDRTRETVKSFLINDNDFLERLLDEAKSLKSSDIHFEIYEDFGRIRYRIDGQLIERYKIDFDNYLELVNKVKIKAKLNITEKRLPQDGRITNKNVDIRVSILPTLFGEKIVMRLLGQDASNIRLETLGLAEDELYKYTEGIKKPNGIVLISGPTGSGKTTTLYATLQLLNDNKRNIVTVEDPIEYTLKGINQVQLKEDIGLTFASALKSFLRQDPDIIMLGEIRDPETAMMAIRASLTGHLVLSTIHTNSALGTISRLIDMGVPAYLIAETLNLSVAQRLIRKLCDDCKVKEPVNEDNFPKSFKIPYSVSYLHKAVGCNSCFHTGYKGRIAIYEVLGVVNEIAEAIKSSNVNEALFPEGHKSLSRKAYDILTQGQTSLEEIYSILINI